MRAISLLTRISLVLVVLATAVQEVQAQTRPIGYGTDRYVNEVQRQLDRFARDSGYRRTHDLFFDHLDDDQYQYVTVDLTAGVRYLFVGACDNDCSDLDFTLYDANGNYVDGDTASDDTPMVRVTPRRTGNFELRVRMYECSVNPCSWGVGVYRR